MYTPEIYINIFLEYQWHETGRKYKLISSIAMAKVHRGMHSCIKGYKGERHITAHALL